MATVSALVVLAAAVALPAAGQATHMLTADKNNEYGLVYTLPVTGVQVDLTARFTERVAGPYRQYAPRFLGNVQVVEADSRSCELTGAEVRTVGRAGTEKYLMTVKPGATTAICVDADGMLLAVNTEIEPSAEQPLAVAERPARPQMDEYLQYVDEDFLVSLSDAKKAQMLARTIMDIRESRLSLTRGTAETMPTDGRQLELMLQSLEAQENALMRAFVGYEYSYTESRRVELVPDSAMMDGERVVLARLAPGEHFAASDDLVGEPVYFTVSDVQEPEMPLNAKGEPKDFPKNAVVYCIPAQATLKVSYMGRVMKSVDVQMAQGGILFGLDPKLFTDRKAPSYAIFNPATGAVETVAQMSREDS